MNTAFRLIMVGQNFFRIDQNFQKRAFTIISKRQLYEGEDGFKQCWESIIFILFKGAPFRRNSKILLYTVLISTLKKILLSKTEAVSSSLEKNVQDCKEGSGLQFNKESNFSL